MHSFLIIETLCEGEGEGEGDFWVRRINLLPGPNFLSVESTGPRFFGQPSGGGLEPATVPQAVRRPVDLAMALIP